jgi:hypothetical protein
MSRTLDSSPDFEKQDDDAQACKDLDRRVHFEVAKPANAKKVKTAERHTGKELSEHCRLSNRCREVSRKLGGREDDCECEDYRSNGIYVRGGPPVVRLSGDYNREQCENDDEGKTTRKVFPKVFATSLLLARRPRGWRPDHPNTCSDCRRTLCASSRRF